MSPIETLALLRRRLLTLTGKLSFLAPALLRLTVGLVFIGTGWDKLHDLGALTENFVKWGIPLPGLNAAVAASTEFFGGILILAGLGTRLVALPMAFTMVVAIAKVQIKQVESVADFFGLVEWSYLVIFLTIALIGPGALSLDALLARRFARAERSAADPGQAPGLAASPPAAR
jgi:putative oxidoreductase